MSAAPHRGIPGGRDSGSSEAQVTIRLASIDHLRDIVTIWSAGQLDQGEKPPDLNETMSVFRSRLQENLTACGIWVAEVQGIVAGWQSLHRFRANPIHNWAESSTYISQQYKGRGIGRKLLTFATEHAKSAGLSHIEGFIQSRNHAPIKIVESLGWQKVGSIPRANPSDIEWLYYVYAVPNEL